MLFNFWVQDQISHPYQVTKLNNVHDFVKLIGSGLFIAGYE